MKHALHSINRGQIDQSKMQAAKPHELAHGTFQSLFGDCLAGLGVPEGMLGPTLLLYPDMFACSHTIVLLRAIRCGVLPSACPAQGRVLYFVVIYFIEGCLAR